METSHRTRARIAEEATAPVLYSSGCVMAWGRAASWMVTVIVE